MSIDAIKTTAIEFYSAASYASAVSSIESNSGLKTHDYMRRILISHQKNHGLAISTVYKETLRSVINIFGNLYYFDGNQDLTKVPCNIGNPERPIAKMFQENNIKLPVISVIQTTTDDDDNRRRYVPQLIVESVWNIEKQRAERVLSFVPRPVNILYEVSIWTKYIEDMDQIKTQIRSLFNPSLDVITPQSDLTKAFIAKEDDISSFNVGDREDRIVRKTFNITVETYIPSPKFLITNTGKIEMFNAELDLYKC